MIEEEINGDAYWKDAKWAQLNDPLFKYGRGGASVRDGRTSLFTHPRNGFINKFSMSGLEEDKAEIYASLFSEEAFRKVAKWMQKDKILRAKVKYMKTFLRSVDKNFDDAYWKNLFKKKKPKASKKSRK